MAWRLERVSEVHFGEMSLANRALPNPVQYAKPLDNSELTIEQSIAVLIDWWRGNRPL